MGMAAVGRGSFAYLGSKQVLIVPSRTLPSSHAPRENGAHSCCVVDRLPQPAEQKGSRRLDETMSAPATVYHL